MNHPVPLYLTFSDPLITANIQELFAPTVTFSDFNDRTRSTHHSVVQLNEA